MSAALRSRSLHRRDVDLHVAVRSGDHTVVFLHGLAGTGDEWRATIEKLPAEIGLVVPDLRAHGRSRGDMPARLTADAFTTDVVDVIERVVAGPVVLVGQSMGGVIASRVAAARPDLIAHLVMIDAGIAALGEDLDGLEQWLHRADTGHDPKAMLGTIRTVAGDNRHREWASLDCPTTVILAQDSIIDRDDLAAMQRLRPDTTWLSVPGSGHDVHLDRPTAVARVVAATAA